MKGLRRTAETKRLQLSSAALACAVACTAILLAPASARASTITVNSTSDAAANDGACTLREAIIAANTNAASGAAAGECAAGAAGLDTIEFNIPGPGVQTIAPASALPAITEAVFINGYTQPGRAPTPTRPTSGSTPSSSSNLTKLSISRKPHLQRPAGTHHPRTRSQPRRNVGDNIS